MEFKGQYLTYEDYRALGGSLDLTSFNLSEFESRKRIDEKTQCRLKNLDVNEIPAEVKVCEFKMIDSIKKFAESTDNISNVVSENIDGYSTTFLTPTQIRDVINSKEAEIDDIITTSLFGVVVNNEHLIYLGVK